MKMNTGSEEVLDIFDFYYPPWYQPLWVKVLLALGVGMVIGCLLYWFVVRRRKVVKTAWEWALDSLKACNLDACETKNDYKLLYFAMTSTLKQYFFKRYVWDTLDKTDDELVAYLKEKKFDAGLTQELHKMLEGAQTIKFANEDVIKIQAETDLKRAQAIVIHTIPTPAQQASGKKHEKKN